jgi:hypothetical protein
MSDHATLQDAILYFADFEHCKDFMVQLRWPDGVIKCPECGAQKVTWLAKQRVWKCYANHPKPRFSLKTGTIFEDSPIGLEKWLPAVWLLLNCKNGISSYELHRSIGVTQKTAWFMLQRIRLAMQDETAGGKLGGPMGNPVEIDETSIGGKSRNMHSARRRATFNGRAGKTIVMGMLERQGNVRARVISHTANSQIQPLVKSHVEMGATIHSDLQGRQWEMPQHYIHEMVNHDAEEYVRGNVHTNGIENFWSLLKRGVNGTYISVELFHLFRYVDEQAFRYNNRKTDDVHRFVKGMQQIVGRRLTYKQLIGKEQVAQHG